MAQPSASYKRSARLAVAGLLGFVLAYFSLAGFFLWNAWRLGRTAMHANEAGGLWLVVGCNVFFGLFMLKSIFSVRNATPSRLTEITAKEEPRLFAFLHELADTAGAPRAHRVFLSNRVNAAVFYDLSLLNLLLPSKKNLEIGLPLVNALPLGELRAVLAHEFGHFAQRSMAVGRWVYMAQQIAGHLVAQRDQFDRLLDWLGRLDYRLRIFAWALQLVVWSIRSLVEMAFRVVLLMQSALSREMELQADLVAVALTGSDALIHALHRLHAADDAWQRAVQFVHNESAQGCAVADAYAVQSLVTRRMAAILDDDRYGDVPPVPAESPARHRVFRQQLGHPPKMWQSHPLNHEREENAKRHYVAAPIDATSAWSLFEQPAILRERMSSMLAGAPDQPLAAIALADSLQKVSRLYRREQFNRRYCGIYFGRDIARHTTTATDLRQLVPADATAGAALYPAALRDDVRALRALREERDQLQALVAGWTSARNGRVRLRGEDCARRDLPAALARCTRELEEVEGRLRAHDLRCRSWHQAMAQQLGGDWREYLDGLLAVVHYAEHTHANVADVHGLAMNVVAIETAVRRIGSEAIVRVVTAANDLHRVLEQAYAAAYQLDLDARLRRRLGAQEGCRDLLGEFTLPLAQRDNLGDWLPAVGHWVEHTLNRLSALRSAALEQLLVAEALVALHVRRGTVPRPAPAPTVVPPGYATLLPGEERKRRDKLDLWARFLRADGWLPGGARLLVAGGIVGLTLGAGIQQGKTTIHIHNGLMTPLAIEIDGNQTTVGAGSSAELLVEPAERHRVSTRTAKGEPVEEFSVPDATNANVYNVAGATPLVQWTAHYGGTATTPAQPLGAPRWLDSKADVVLRDPPRSVSTKHGPATRTVLQAVSGFAHVQLQALPDDAARRRIIAAHARWDETSAQDTWLWLRFATEYDNGAALAERLRKAPDDMLLLRLRQDLAGAGKAAVCAADIARARAAPDDGDLAYLALRCRSDGAEAQAGFRAALARWPHNAWLHHAISYDLMLRGDFRAMAPHLQPVIDKLPAMRSEAALMAARLRRLEQGGAADIGPYLPSSPRLRVLAEDEQPTATGKSPTDAVARLAVGDLAAAWTIAMDDAPSPRIQRLVGASEGATPEQVKRALAMPLAEGIDGTTVLTSAALAMREGRDAAPYLQAADDYLDGMPAVLDFLQAVRARRSQRECEAALGKVGSNTRLHAYAAAVVLLKERAPADWRKLAGGMLFATERPYFR
ncbi:M48 family metallopeptidase [Pseudoduganella chitinolytica]|uniref:M48 family metallopeptidase n=1 Tax=Pseudoduganella chitinolytica TaxID=34070 RepID=A0ABY8BB86_9BURK|nr:M48 family metallopeptidase [Pseudoduganella chitinolytica]WEF32403.1 M48 family metallopeptidase [Pseudoduganella chitinolytica]